VERAQPTVRPPVQEESTLRPATSFALLALLATIVVAAAVQLARSAAL
jgi:hypothetical protein